MIEDGSDEEYDSDDENGKGRRGRRGKKGAKGREKDEEVRPGSWHRMECLRLERGLLAWGLVWFWNIRGNIFSTGCFCP